MQHNIVLGELKEDMGAAPLRLLRAIFELAEQSSTDSSLWTVPKNAVLDALAAAEGRMPSAETQRSRVKLINDGAKLLGNRRYGGTRPFALSSRKTHFEVRFDPALKETWARLNAGRQAAKSADEDSNIAVGEYEEPQVVEIVPNFQVFISHAHESDEVEAVVKRFGEELQRKLRHLSYKYKGKFTVSLWLDHFNMRGPKAFEHQTDPECERSDLAIFLLSDRWYDSAACQREAAHFNRKGSAKAPRYFQLQLSGEFQNGDPQRSGTPCFPMKWRTSVANLLALWGLPLADRDEFLTRLRDEICDDIAERHFPPPSGGGTAPVKSAPVSRCFEMRERLLSSAERHDYEPVIQDGNTEEPHVTPQEGGETTEDGVSLLVDWACSDKSPNRMYALLGSFGSGKTTTSQLFVRKLIERRQTEAGLATPVPIYLDLRRLNEIYGRDSAPPPLAELIRLSLHPDVRENVESDQLLSFLRTEPCVIVFDGLDEVGTRIGAERLASLYRVMLEVVPSAAWKADREVGAADWKACPARILVTCRTHFFRDHIEQESVLRERDRFAGLQARDGYEPIKTIYMAPFQPDQIHSFFRKILGEEAGDAAYESVARIQDLSGLASKPIMARYIAELAPDLEEDAREGRVINVARLYGHLFRRTLERDNDKQPILKPLDRQKMLERLAERLWQQRTTSLPVDKLDDWLDEYAESTPGIRATAMTSLNARGLLQTELRNASLLVRENDDIFRFVHSSFFEYFLAKRLLHCLLHDELAAMPDVPPVSAETRAFLLDLVAMDDGWDRLAEALDRALMPGNSVPLRALAFEIRRTRLGRDQDRPFPVGADLSGLDLTRSRWVPRTFRKADFSGANLRGGTFENVSFVDCDFSGAILAETRFDTCSFAGCRGEPRFAASARLHDCDIDAASDRAVLGAVILRDWSGSAILDTDTLPEGVRLGLPYGGYNGVAAFSPDGRAILTASEDIALLLDADLGLEIMALKAHGGWIESAAFSADGSLILTASSDGIARLWDAATGAMLRIFEGHGGPGTHAIFSPDLACIFTASSAGEAKRWEIATGACLQTYPCAASLKDVAVFPDGNTLLTVSSEVGVEFWDVQTAAKTRVLSTPSGGICGAALSPDGKTIVTVSPRSRPVIWDAATGAVIATFERAAELTDRVVFSPDGKTVALRNGLQTQLWNLDTMQPFEQFTARPSSIAFSPSGALILSANFELTLREVAAGAEVVGSVTPSNGSIENVAFDSTWTSMVTVNGDSAQLWKVGAASPTWIFGVDEGVDGADISPKGDLIVTFAANIARIWNADSGTVIATFNGHTSAIEAAAFSPDGSAVATGSEDGTVRLWDAQSGTEIRMMKCHSGGIQSVAFSPDGASIVTASTDYSAGLWHLASGSGVTLLEGHTDWVRSAIFSPDGKTILTASDDHSFRLWDATTGAELHVAKGHGGWVQSAVFSPDGTTILSAGDDSTLKLWDVATWKEIRVVSTQSAAKAIFSPDGKRIALVANDLRLIDFQSGDTLMRIDYLPESWITRDAEGNILTCGPNAWKSVHGIRTRPDGGAEVISPFGLSATREAALTP